MGQPVAGNPTQYMMEKAFVAAGLDLRFLTLEVSPEQLGDAVRGVRAMGFSGVIVLEPHGAAAVEFLDELSPAAKVIGEVNLIDREGDRLTGDNTVGKGLLQSIGDAVDFTGRPVVILGAGSAARAIAVEMGLAGASEITVVNRTADHGQALADLLTERVGVRAQFVHWVGDFVPPEDVAVVVQATSIGTGDSSVRVALTLETLRPGTLVADMRFNPPNTQLLQDAAALNLATRNGLQILVNQAVIAFKNWTGIEPDRGIMHDALEEFLML